MLPGRHLSMSKAFCVDRSWGPGALGIYCVEKNLLHPTIDREALKIKNCLVRMPPGWLLRNLAPGACDEDNRIGLFHVQQKYDCRASWKALLSSIHMCLNILREKETQEHLSGRG